MVFLFLGFRATKEKSPRIPSWLGVILPKGLKTLKSWAEMAKAFLRHLRMSSSKVSSVSLPQECNQVTAGGALGSLHKRLLTAFKQMESE